VAERLPRSTEPRTAEARLAPLELTPYAEFGTLRLHQFVPPGEIRELSDWRYMGEEWVGEAAGFNEALRLARDPEVTRTLSLDLSSLPEPVQRSFWTALKLPLRKGMSREQLSDVLGAPVQTLRFPRARDRTTYAFEVGTRWPYTLLCTVLDEGGLIYVSVQAPTR
jgi:hypothetical protein